MLPSSRVRFLCLFLMWALKNFLSLIIPENASKEEDSAYKLHDMRQRYLLKINFRREKIFFSSRGASPNFIIADVMKSVCSDNRVHWMNMYARKVKKEEDKTSE